MSIVTKTGDDGTTALMYGRRVPKHHPRITACGAVDELNAALGLTRATTQDDFLRENLLPIQKNLVALMGELATANDDWPRYLKDGFPQITSQKTAILDRLVQELEGQLPPTKDWVMPGGNANSASLDVARTVCRRAERHVCELRDAGELTNGEVIVYLNRLADLLWLMARWSEKSV